MFRFKSFVRAIGGVGIALACAQAACGTPPTSAASSEVLADEEYDSNTLAATREEEIKRAADQLVATVQGWGQSLTINSGELKSLMNLAMPNFARPVNLLFDSYYDSTTVKLGGVKADGNKVIITIDQVTIKAHYWLGIKGIAEEHFYPEKHLLDRASTVTITFEPCLTCKEPGVYKVDITTDLHFKSEITFDFVVTDVGFPTNVPNASFSGGMVVGPKGAWMFGNVSPDLVGAMVQIDLGSGGPSASIPKKAGGADSLLSAYK